MANGWIIDVLADLETYANKNGLPTLSRHLEDTTLVAVKEIASLDRKAQETAGWEIGTTGRLYRANPASESA